MSKAAFWQRGESIDFTNATSEKIEANSVMVFGSRICVAGADILPGETGSIHMSGVFVFPKGGEEITAGAEVYYAESDGTITSQEGGGVKAGFAVSGAATDDNKILVKINA